MELELQQIVKEEEELKALNQQLNNRAIKFGSEFTPLTLGEFKIFKIQKARETGNIQYLDGILLEEIQDLQERKKKIKERLQNFYPELKVQEGDKFFAEKEVPDFSEDNLQVRPGAWYIFGVDYMSNQKIRNYFNVNPNFRIQWINDSSCNLVYNTKQEADQAIKPHVKGQGMKEQNDIWYELQEYEVEGVKRKLYCRLSTSKDCKKQEVHGHKSQYYKWVINKEKLGNYVKHKANWEIRKTKGIGRDNKYHQPHNKKGERVEKHKKEEEDSSSGVDDSDQMQ